MRGQSCCFFGFETWLEPKQLLGDVKYVFFNFCTFKPGHTVDAVNIFCEENMIQQFFTFDHIGLVRCHLKYCIFFFFCGLWPFFHFKYTIFLLGVLYPILLIFRIWAPKNIWLTAMYPFSKLQKSAKSLPPPPNVQLYTMSIDLRVDVKETWFEPEPLHQLGMWWQMFFAHLNRVIQ